MGFPLLYAAGRPIPLGTEVVVVECPVEAMLNGRYIVVKEIKYKLEGMPVRAYQLGWRDRRGHTYPTEWLASPYLSPGVTYATKIIRWEPVKWRQQKKGNLPMAEAEPSVWQQLAEKHRELADLYEQAHAAPEAPAEEATEETTEGEPAVEEAADAPVERVFNTQEEFDSMDMGDLVQTAEFIRAGSSKGMTEDKLRPAIKAAVSLYEGDEFEHDAGTLALAAKIAGVKVTGKNVNDQAQNLADALGKLIQKALEAQQAAEEPAAEEATEEATEEAAPAEEEASTEEADEAAGEAAEEEPAAEPEAGAPEELPNHKEIAQQFVADLVEQNQFDEEAIKGEIEAYKTNLDEETEVKLSQIDKLLSKKKIQDAYTLVMSQFVNDVGAMVGADEPYVHGLAPYCNGVPMAQVEDAEGLEAEEIAARCTVTDKVYAIAQTESGTQFREIEAPAKPAPAKKPAAAKPAAKAPAKAPAKPAAKAPAKPAAKAPAKPAAKPAAKTGKPAPKKK